MMDEHVHIRIACMPLDEKLSIKDLMDFILGLMFELAIKDKAIRWMGCLFFIRACRDHCKVFSQFSWYWKIVLHP
jgi:hypothetical protein